jgi:excisionase family DNA binding protein
MRKETTGKPIQKPCRTFPDATENHVPCSVATRIERHRGMLTPAALAELLAVSPKSIYSWVKSGRLPAVILGASIRFDPYDTAAWVRARTA